MQDLQWSGRVFTEYLYKNRRKNQNDLNLRMNNLSIKNSLLLSSDASFKVKVFLYKEAYKFSEIKGNKPT